MKTITRISIVAAVAGLAVFAFVVKQRPPGPATPTPMAAGLAPTVKLPRLLDLGADKCVPCKMMAPILAELKRDYADQFSTEFIDVWQNPEAGQHYGIEVIPTQIFFAADGTELFRHVGFFAKDDLLARWRELGVPVAAKILDPPPPTNPGPQP